MLGDCSLPIVVATFSTPRRSRARGTRHDREAGENARKPGVRVTEALTYIELNTADVVRTALRSFFCVASKGRASVAALVGLDEPVAYGNALSETDITGLLRRNRCAPLHTKRMASDSDLPAEVERYRVPTRLGLPDDERAADGATTGLDAAVGGTTRALGSLRAYLVVTTPCLCSALANPFRKTAKCEVTSIAGAVVSCDVRGGHLSAKQNTDASAA
jgi:hypothetical protein